MNACGDLQAAPLVLDRQAVAALDLHRGGALGEHLGDQGGARAASSASVAARVAATVVRMPPAV